MKGTKWLLIKLTLIFGCMVLIYGANLYDVSAQQSGCNTSQACTGTFSCHCGDSDCSGCFIPNGQGGCGTCAKGSGGELELE